MHIQLTNEASEQLQQQYTRNGEAVLKLVYDAEGCGCAVSGVPTLWVMNKQQLEDDDISALSEPLRIVYEARHEVFFEEQLKLDYLDNKRSFKLSSANQIYANDLAIVDKRV